MSDYIVTCDEETASWIGNDVDSMIPLVRCRDCRNRAGENEQGIPSYKVNRVDPYFCVFHHRHVQPNFFCEWGEPKGDSE